MNLLQQHFNDQDAVHEDEDEITIKPSAFRPRSQSFTYVVIHSCSENNLILCSRKSVTDNCLMQNYEMHVQFDFSHEF